MRRYRVAPAPLLTLAKQHPGLELEISFSDRPVDLPEEGFDLAVRIGALPDTSTLVALALGSHTMGFCASPEYLRDAGEPLSPEELTTGSLQEILKDQAAGSWPVYAVWPRTPHLTLKVRLAVDKLVNDFPAMMATL